MTTNRPPSIVPLEGEKPTSAGSDAFPVRLVGTRATSANDATDLALLPVGALWEPGTILADRYRLLEAIGEGGMGTVFRAEQLEPVQREVAIKVIRGGFASASAQARFEAEGQTLALMDHPHIAKVLDGGTLPGVPPRPYFVMELVRGRPIGDFCRLRRLTLRQRLRLFRLVCLAVQHAHQKGIIHRDLKPGNILVSEVDGQAQPKVIDFGVAKAVTGQLIPGEDATRLGMLVGTMEYMAPEQTLSGLQDLDTRVDVYALGAILYELLCGFPVVSSTSQEGRTVIETLRLIQDIDPIPPSRRLSGRAVTGERLPAELDWIVMKCLEKDRERRYGSALELASEVEHWLRDEPLIAGPPSTLYRLRKFLRRHRLAVAVSGTGAACLMAAVVGVTWGWVQALEAKQESARERDTARLAAAAARRAKEDAQAAVALAVVAEQTARESEADLRSYSDFLVQQFLAAARPKGLQAGQGSDITVVEALEKAEPEIERFFAHWPRAEARTRHAIGVTWRNLGRFDRSEPHLRRAVALAEAAYGPTHSVTLDYANSLAVLLLTLDQPAEAVRLLERCLENQEGAALEINLTQQQNLAIAYCHSGRSAEGMALLRKLLALSASRIGTDDLTTLMLSLNLANELVRTGEIDEARQLIATAVATLRDQPLTGPEIGACTCYAWQLQTAILRADQRLEEAVNQGQELLELNRQWRGPLHPDTLKSQANLARDLLRLERPEAARDLLLDLQPKVRQALGPAHSSSLLTELWLAECDVALKRWPEAIRQLQSLIPRLQTTVDVAVEEVWHARRLLAVAFFNSNRPADSIDLARAAFRERTDSFQNQPEEWLFWTEMLGRSLLHLGQPATAAPYLKAALDHRRYQKTMDGIAGIDTLLLWSIVLHSQARYEDELTALDEALAWFNKNDPDHPYLSSSRIYRGRCLLRLGRPIEAEAELRSVLKERVQSQPQAWTTTNLRVLLGAALAAQGRLTEAEKLLIPAVAALEAQAEQIPPMWQVVRVSAWADLARLHKAAGRSDDAATCRAKAAALAKDLPSDPGSVQNP
ncbi:MAG TPA: serine/threonine-protein kinase [Gemmatales bacterium]|nr:serine/threonine-protein kinase [Gemmatales bacterium]HMP60006.1 serine/threonine-protein kinase [Gemmatales bacterium]